MQVAEFNCLFIFYFCLVFVDFCLFIVAVVIVVLVC